MNSKSLQYNYINSPLFVISLCLLLLNDFYLKDTFHNFLTGVISDLFGIITFVLFFSDVFKDSRKTVYIITAIAFTIWKSPFSTPFIDYFSEHFYSINRMVDYTDLLVLCLLPLIYNYTPTKLLTKKFQVHFLSFIALFAFSATSKSRPSISFDPPQYFCFKYNPNVIDTAYVNSTNKMTLKNEYVIIEVDEFQLEQEPLRWDDYSENQVISKMQYRIASEIIKQQIDSNKQNTIIRSLIPSGLRRFDIQNNEFLHYINFKGAMMDGTFKRYANDGKLTLEGKYIQGIKTGVWNYYEAGQLVRKVYFNEKGEKIKEELISKKGSVFKSFTTRAVYTFIYYLIASVLSILIGFLFFRTFKSNSKEKNFVENSFVSRLSRSFVFTILAMILTLMLGVITSMTIISPLTNSLTDYFYLIQLIFILNLIFNFSKILKTENQFYIINLNLVLLYFLSRIIYTIYLLSL